MNPFGAIAVGVIVGLLVLAVFDNPFIALIVGLIILGLLAFAG